MMTIVEALSDPSLLGALPAFRDLSTWRPWLAFLKAFYGLPLDGEELALFREHTGRLAPRPGGYPEAVAITGRQSGKSAMAGTLAAFEAATGTERGTYALLVAQDARGAQRALFRYARQPFEEVPVLAREVERDNVDELALRSGVTMACYPCRPQAVRGIRARVAVVDELGFFISSDGRPTDREMLRAIRPTLATTGGKLLILSSPYGQTGALWDLHRQHFGRDESAVLVWKASAPEMNPTLPPDYIERMRDDDPEAYRSEVLGEFRAGLTSLFDPDALDACVARGVREVPPASGVHYVAHYDASGGRGDAAALAVAHVEASGLVRVDLARRWPAPHNPEEVIGEAAGVLKTYDVRHVQVDRFGGDFPVAAFKRFSVTAEVADRSTSEHHLAMLPVVNAGRVLLLDSPDLLRELRGLERRTGSGGKDRADHRPGAHDDVASAVSGVVAMLAARGPRDLGLTVGRFSA